MCVHTYNLLFIYMYGYICVHANISHCILYDVHIPSRSMYSMLCILGVLHVVHIVTVIQNTLALHTKVNVYHMRVSFSVVPNC